MSPPAAPKTIEIMVPTLQHLFESMDPSPFRERDLDAEAERFILDWASEYHARTPLRLVVHLGEAPETGEPSKTVAESVHHYFEYRAELNRRGLRLLLGDGWKSLVIGLCFLALCGAAARGVAPRLGAWEPIFQEGFTIIGWVAMWRPLDIYLYRWWPLRREGRILRKLSGIPVEVILSEK